MPLFHASVVRGQVKEIKTEEGDWPEKGELDPKKPPQKTKNLKAVSTDGTRIASLICSLR